MSREITACIIIIGNEILSGRTQDTNISHIAKVIGAWGIQVHHCRVIPDDEHIIVQTINEVRPAYDYVFTTGGIGPTHDDITSVSIAKAFDVPVIQHPDIEAVIRQRPASAEVMASRLLMARVPEGARLIDNPSGGPQGFAIENVHVMAGIPRVMQAMLSSLEGKLRRGAVMHSRTVRAYLGESSIADALAGIQRNNPDVDIGSYPFLKEDRYGTHLVARGSDPAQLVAVIDQIMRAVRERGEEPVELREDGAA